MDYLQLTIKDITQQTSHSKTYWVETTNGQPIIYMAGQFLTLIVSLHGKEIRRSYSISSTPGVDTNVYFTLKKVQNGELSRYLFDYLKPGDVIASLPPSGRFIIEDIDFETAIFIVAGSGITPVFSLIKHLLYHTKATNVLLIYQNNNEADSIFRKELQHLEVRFANRFTLNEIFSQPTDHTYYSQRLNNSLLERIINQQIKNEKISFFLCGPETFMRMAQFTLKVMGYAEQKIRKENFFATAPPPPFMVDKSPHKVTIHSGGTIHVLEVAYPENILEVALKQNIKLPYSCRGGRCSTCTAKCISGKVKMSINEVLTQNDLAKGFILTCVGYPETDVELTYDT